MNEHSASLCCGHGVLLETTLLFIFILTALSTHSCIQSNSFIMCNFIRAVRSKLRGEYAYLLFHDDTGHCSLYHVSSVQAIHAVNPEDALLLADDSCLVYPIYEKRWILIRDKKGKGEYGG